MKPEIQVALLAIDGIQEHSDAFKTAKEIVQGMGHSEERAAEVAHLVVDCLFEETLPDPESYEEDASDVREILQMLSEGGDSREPEPEPDFTVNPLEERTLLKLFMAMQDNFKGDSLQERTEAVQAWLLEKGVTDPRANNHLVVMVLSNGLEVLQAAGLSREAQVNNLASVAENLGLSKEEAREKAVICQLNDDSMRFLDAEFLIRRKLEELTDSGAPRALDITRNSLSREIMGMMLQLREDFPQEVLDNNMDSLSALIRDVSNAIGLKKL